MSAVPPRCGDGSAWLYHGSQALVSRLERKATRGVGPAPDRLRAVYASHEKSFAAAFALPLVPDARGRLEWSLQFTREPHITIHAGALDTHRVRYLYRVPADRFVPLDDLQWVSYRSVAAHDYRVLDTATYARWIGSRRKATSNSVRLD